MRLFGWFRRDEKELVIPPLSPAHYRFRGHDEQLEMRARVRRDIAASLKKRSALVASGSSSTSVLKMVRKA